MFNAGFLFWIWCSVAGLLQLQRDKGSWRVWLSVGWLAGRIGRVGQELDGLGRDIIRLIIIP